MDSVLVREVLKQASRNPHFGASLLKKGSEILSGYALRMETKAAIMAGDTAWIEKRCGRLSDEEREWLLRRLQAEIW